MPTDRLPTYTDTARWTSKRYGIQFERVKTVRDATTAYETPFRLSAWGISKGLYSLLDHYTDSTLHRAADRLTTQQNPMVANLLEAMERDSARRGIPFPPLEQIFISVDAELFLPRGLRMHITCVTNIVHHGDDTLDKFVAVLDPGEVRSYIDERKQYSYLLQHISH